MAIGQPRQPICAPSSASAVLRIRTAQERGESGMADTTAGRLATEWEARGPRLATQAWVAEASNGSLLACAELVREGQVCVPRL